MIWCSLPTWLMSVNSSWHAEQVYLVGIPSLQHYNSISVGFIDVRTCAGSSFQYVTQVALCQLLYERHALFLPKRCRKNLLLPSKSSVAWVPDCLSWSRSWSYSRLRTFVPPKATNTLRQAQPQPQSINWHTPDPSMIAFFLEISSTRRSFFTLQCTGEGGSFRQDARYHAPRNLGFWQDSWLWSMLLITNFFPFLHQKVAPAPEYKSGFPWSGNNS